MTPAADWLPCLLGTATVLPLASFFLILVFGNKMGKAGVCAGYLATLAIGLAALLSFASLFFVWLPTHGPTSQPHGDSAAHISAVDPTAEQPDVHRGESHHAPLPYTGEFQILGVGTPWVLAQSGNLRLSVSYYIDSLTVCMFCMVSLIATLIHVYSMGYMQDELAEVTDREVTMQDGAPLRRRGRYHVFFLYLSLFSFSMLGLVLAGNVALVFVFWELVGICSYFLIGFYVERKSASTAGNKAFIVNRIGDFGMIVGMMALWASLGTFSFGDVTYLDLEGKPRFQAGIFSLLRDGSTVRPSAGMRELAARVGLFQEHREQQQGRGGAAQPGRVGGAIEELRADTDGSRERAPLGYGLLILAGLGIFAGCVGKSAQFPLHVWLPDAMEGPTPVSALVHSATMVAAGVYLAGRFFPVFAPEVLLVIAVVGCVTLFMAATIALTATDIKRVLAYSTISQLGYMMMAIGVGAWMAAMLHLITHAFFKSLLFMCSGSVIHAVHTNEMTQMGGLLKKMPVTAFTMLVGCLAIAGAGLPFVIGSLGGPDLAGLGLSGFYSKDAILEQAYSFMQQNSSAWAAVFFLAGAGGAAITAFYMFRMWYLTFIGRPRDVHRFEHAHESPPVMYVPLIILAVMAIAIAWEPLQGLLGSALAAIVFLILKLLARRTAVRAEAHPKRWALADLPLGLSLLVFAIALLWWLTPLNGVVLQSLLGQSEPANSQAGAQAVLISWAWPAAHLSHARDVVLPVTLVAMGASLAGFALATLMYGLGRLSPDDVRRQFELLYRFLRNKWWFDELYDLLFVKPSLLCAQCAAAIDRAWIDRFLDGTVRTVRVFSVVWDRVADQTLVDGCVNGIAAWTYAVGRSLRSVQTGRVRQYVMFIVIGALAIFILISLWNSTLAG